MAVAAMVGERELRAAVRRSRRRSTGNPGQVLKVDRAGGLRDVAARARAAVVVERRDPSGWRGSRGGPARTGRWSQAFAGRNATTGRLARPAGPGDEPAKPRRHPFAPSPTRGADRYRAVRATALRRAWAVRLDGQSADRAPFVLDRPIRVHIIRARCLRWPSGRSGEATSAGSRVGADSDRDAKCCRRLHRAFV